jgi:hypothetical protein
MRFRRGDGEVAREAVELCVLGTILIAIGVFLVPCHWTSIWMDREFTGSVVPIGNRIAAGQLLYVDGGHMPMAPLPFVLVYWLWHGRAVWLSESFLNFTCQSLTILIMLRGLCRYIPGPAPFLAALATVPIFFSLPKAVLYDSLTQALVAVVAVIAVWTVLPTTKSGDHQPIASPLLSDSRVRRATALLLLGFVTAICLLSKQSTGAGAFLGVCLLLAWFPRSISAGRRIRHTTLYLATTLAAMLCCLVALSPWLSIGGLVMDVFLTGSEPKGGVRVLLHNIASFAKQIFGMINLGVLVMLGVFALLVFVGNRRSVGDGSRRSRRGSGIDIARLSIVGTALAGAALGLWFLPPGIGRIPPFLVVSSSALGYFPRDILSTGFFLCVGLLGLSVLPRRLTGTHSKSIEPLACFALMTLAAALFHNLSVQMFRWTYDNNPLIMVALAVIFIALVESLHRLFSARPSAAAALTCVGAFVAQFGLWTTVGAQVDTIRECTETWPEVRHLAGARLRKSAEGMRDLVALVRELAPSADDSVLLLPSDPNVEAWFERPRITLSSAIILPDQYWDRYIDSDMARLRANLPAVIVIGPRRFWPLFFRFGGPGWSQAATTLIDRVQQEIVSAHYRLAKTQNITYLGGEDFMDVYVRQPPQS